MRAPLQSVHANRSGHGGDVSTEWVEDWMTRAACRGVDRDGQDRFHPSIDEKADGGRNGVAAAAYGEALRFCTVCPVRLECLDLAMRVEGNHAGSRHGMWGGLTARQRRTVAGVPREVWPALIDAATHGRGELFNRLVERHRERAS